jgi:uncharacterized protein YjbI with pentapeptide repeats
MQAATQLARPGFVRDLLRALRHHAVQLLLATERVTADLHGESDCDYLAANLPRELVRAVGAAVARDDRALEHLHGLLAGPAWSHPMAASILHAADVGWVPQSGTALALAKAYLDGAVWPGVRLPLVNLAEVDLTAADLRRANLTGAVATRATLRLANLREAVLVSIDATGADLIDAELSSSQGAGARFDSAVLAGARLEEADLCDASFAEADLTRASFRLANLTGATLADAKVKGADFSGATLAQAQLSGLFGMSLRWATFLGASFAGAHMSACDLEYMDLPGANFEGASLEGALLTGSSMPEANFKRAYLREARLADVNWERADLRRADLRGATFHMGSSRSGLVFSPYAGEGSKTGFYTDDYDEQSYKSPEEIRKANLCGADLRGALLDNVDFYLVDLRGALYDPEHERHFRRCGAILETRVQG